MKHAQLSFALLLATCMLPAQTPELRTVAALDLERYLGRWYEIARLPNRFQKSCLGDVTATYAMQADGKLSVVNRCREQDGTNKAEGAARQVGEAKLKVRFAPAWLSFLPMVWGNYWVIDLAEDYSWAVVGEPSREYFWILSRKSRMEKGLIKQIVERAEGQGYDLSTLKRTEQAGGC
jgi:apolipoprotein D and lipocalin family protein